ncbi:MAG: chromosome partitioning protein ParB, partial [Cyanobacteriota bacterium]|nr:chromosome partitioning protein ParB [Cyanobacteriota bacterium]
ESVGMTWESFVANRLPLLKLPEEILEALRCGKIAYTKAKAIARVKEEGERQQILEEAIAQNLSLSQIKERIGRQRARTAPEPATPKKQWQTLSGRIDRARLWEDTKTWRKVETLMRKLEALLPAEDKTPSTEDN